MPQVPEKIANFEVYAGQRSERLLGVADAELPPFDAITEAITGAGIAGTFDSAVPGHFASQSVKVKFRTATTQIAKIPVGVPTMIDLRGAIQVQDPGLGSLVIQAMRVEVRGPVKSLKLGKFEPGKPMDAELEVEVSTIRISFDGVPHIELDKLLNIYNVDGVDYLAGVRAATGQ